MFDKRVAGDVVPDKIEFLPQLRSGDERREGRMSERKKRLEEVTDRLLTYLEKITHTPEGIALNAEELLSIAGAIKNMEDAITQEDRRQAENRTARDMFQELLCFNREDGGEEA